MLMPYTKPDTAYPVEACDALLQSLQDGAYTKALLSALGDFWRDYYVDSEVLNELATGAVALYSKEYSSLLHTVMASNILDIPTEKPVRYQLYAFGEAFIKEKLTPSGEIDYYYIDVENLSDIEYLVSSLFQPEVVLEKGQHYTIVDNQIRFYVDIFNDPGVSGYSYVTLETPHRTIYFWAVNIVFHDSLIYYRYGKYLYKSGLDSIEYKTIVMGLLWFYVNTKSLNRIEAVLNILHGIPIARFSSEKVVDISIVDTDLNPIEDYDYAVFYKVVTDKFEYYVDTLCDLNVKVGDIVGDFELFGRLHVINDYISNPELFRTLLIPKDLIVDYVESPDGTPLNITEDFSRTFVEKVLKYNTVHIRLAVSYSTYANYKDTIKELHTLIKTGFPVYVYPFIETIFVAKFISQVESEDDFRFGKYNCPEDGFDWNDPDTWPPGVDPGDPETWCCTSGIHFRHEDIVTKCKTFNGLHNYYSKPALDHGSKYLGYDKVLGKFILNPIHDSSISYDDIYLHKENEHLTDALRVRKVDQNFFNNKSNYDFHDGTPDWHRPMPKDIPTFNSKFAYSLPVNGMDADLHSFMHDCETEQFSIKYMLGLETEYVWADTDKNPKYDIEFGHTGSISFSGHKITDNDQFNLKYENKFSDTITVTDSDTLSADVSIPEFYGGAVRFGGASTYSGAVQYKYNMGSTLTFTGSKKYDTEIRHFGVIGTGHDQASNVSFGKVTTLVAHSDYIRDDFVIRIFKDGQPVVPEGPPPNAVYSNGQPVLNPYGEGYLTHSG